MYDAYKSFVQSELQGIRQAGFFKGERIISTPQAAQIGLAEADELINLCANNYLGLAQHPEVLEAARLGLEKWGYGMASVRFICGTQEVHKELESEITSFLQTQDTILYPSCFDANGGLFEVLLGPEDAVISDELNHASIIDGIRLCKAKRYRYRNNDMEELEARLQAADAEGARFKLITTDGVFSMDGYLARLPEICDLAEKYDALVHVDDSHATGFVGSSGRGTPEHFDCAERVDIVTGTLGKALGGASGGFASGKAEIVELLRQRSRPYLFSNTVAPSLCSGAIEAIRQVAKGGEIRSRLSENIKFFRSGMTEAGFDLLDGSHPIIPVMLYDAERAAAYAEALLQHKVYVIAFSYPVVPKDKARIRCQISAAHSRDELSRAIDAFVEVKRELG